MPPAKKESGATCLAASRARPARPARPRHAGDDVQKYNFCDLKPPFVSWLNQSYICAFRHSLSLPGPFYRSVLTIIYQNPLLCTAVHSLFRSQIFSSRIHPWIQARTLPQLGLTRKRGKGNRRGGTQQAVCGRRAYISPGRFSARAFFPRAHARHVPPRSASPPFGRVINSH